MSAETLLEVSRRCAQVLARDGAGASTKTLVAASGLSERTFFRCFQTKAECIRPLLEDGYRRFVSEVSSRCGNGGDSSLLAVVTVAFAVAYAKDSAPDGELARLLVEAPAYRRIWLEINDDTAASLVEPLASALGVPTDSFEARIAADQATSLAVTAMRGIVRSGLSATDAANQAAEAIRRQPLLREKQTNTRGAAPKEGITP
ncbi:hypothetical protein ASD66_00860 [Nocardioides sp. Root151]|nr:hypothetical protein ASD66_00860 [Nocardioides sp. Root151]